MIYNNRTPYVIKEIGDPTLINNELYIDNINGIIYIYKDNEPHIGISYIRLYDIIKMELVKRLGGLTQSKITEMIEESNVLYKWMNDNNDISINTPESNIINIFKVFEGMDPNTTLLNIINDMVDIDGNKQLSTNSFTIDDMIKIDSIMDDANFYDHNSSLQCNLGNMVEGILVDGKIRTGDVIITKDDLGYSGIEPGANNYIHPSKQQCSAGVNSINGDTRFSNRQNMKGSIELDKDDFGLFNFPNVAPALYSDYDNMSTNTLFFGNTAIEYLNNRLTNTISTHKKQIKSKYTLEVTADPMNMIRSISIGGKTINKFNSSNKMIFNIYHDNATISIIDRNENNVSIKNIYNIVPNTIKRIHINTDYTIKEV